MGVVVHRNDMRTYQEEADTMLVQQVALAQPQVAKVIADDTDVFVLLLHFCYHGKLPAKILMASPIHGRTVIDINQTVQDNINIMPNILAMHGILVVIQLPHSMELEKMWRFEY